MNQELNQQQNPKFHINLMQKLCQKAMIKCKEEQINQKFYYIPKKRLSSNCNKQIMNSLQQPQTERMSTEISQKQRRIIFNKKNNYCWSSQENINEKNKQLSNLSLRALKDECQQKEQMRFHIPKLSLGNEKQLRLVQLNKQLQSLTSRQTVKRQASPINLQLRKVNNDCLIQNRQKQLDQMFEAQKKIMKYIIHQDEYFNDALIQLQKSISQ
ncbi:unnamed protein product (macronuclear) [Paramecium tetraurelia]|uniref:Uncharacterized protein n=1 Tax=Paramecium tetraurelia TaxID=5888 RepID=A0E8H0_PARTE|nr:uncharacterized protein GSPATT00024316001 [Paramecium tetraurelia]CAK91587.1 unnamed protein product [Paramecium tetraurelia]|eukprot:XP_001458984.1 hypothetical protein (macronuclear) [Paramecium tetraurelia strain d4-2]